MNFVPRFASCLVPRFAAGFGGAFVLFYLISKINFTHGPATHAPNGEEAREYACPEWLSTRRINFAVAGQGGVGRVVERRL